MLPLRDDFVACALHPIGDPRLDDIGEQLGTPINPGVIRPKMIQCA